MISKSLLFFGCFFAAICLSQAQYYPRPPPSYQPNQPSYYPPSNGYNNQYNSGGYGGNKYSNNYYNKNYNCGNVDLGCLDIKKSFFDTTGATDVSFSILGESAIVQVIEYSANMTNKMCASACYDLGFKFSLTLNSTICACSPFLPNYVPAAQDACNTVCAGNYSETCGSSYYEIDPEAPCIRGAANVFANQRNCISSMEAGLKINVQPVCKPKVLECSLVYVEDVLPISQNYPYMTNEYCAYACADIYVLGINIGTSLSGTFNGTTCACLVSTGVSTAAGNCNVPCIGDKTQTCGASTCAEVEVDECVAAYITLSTTPRGCQLGSYAGVI